MLLTSFMAHYLAFINKDFIISIIIITIIIIIIIINI